MGKDTMKSNEGQKKKHQVMKHEGEQSDYMKSEQNLF
jgi:hypothetical protein